MKKILTCILAAMSLAASAASPDTTVWLAKPAKNFMESSPLGNGRLGAMDFGGVAEERIVLNEDSLWSGSVQNADRTNAAAALPEIRRLLLEGKNAEAEGLVNKNFTCAGAGSGNGIQPYGSYQVLGDLRLEFSFAPRTRRRVIAANWSWPRPRRAPGFCAAASSSPAKFL